MILQDLDETMIPLLTLRNVCYSFPSQEVLRDINLTLEIGSIVAIVGASGSGKSTLLRIVAGLTRPDHGDVLINGMRVADSAPHQRDIGFVFQSENALFPHLNVFDNVAFPFRHGRRPLPDGRQLSAAVGEMLEKTELTNVARQPLHELSGGMRQRVALARAMVYRPGLLLLDEPFSSLHNALKYELAQLVKTLRANTKTGVLFVTHDDREVKWLADRVAVLSKPVLVANDTLASLLKNPPHPTVNELLRSP